MQPGSITKFEVNTSIGHEIDSSNIVACSHQLISPESISMRTDIMTCQERGIPAEETHKETNKQ